MLSGTPKGQLRGRDDKSAELRGERDAAILQLVIDEQKSRDEVAEKFKISGGLVDLILKKHSNKDIIERYIWDHKDVQFSGADEISRALSIDVNKVNFAIDTMQKRGMVTAVKGASRGDHAQWVNIKYRESTKWKAVEAAIEEAVEQPSAPEPEPEPQEGVPPTPAEVEAFAVDYTAEEEESYGGMLASEMARYPIVAQLLDKDRKLTEAAKLIESAGGPNNGLDDLALEVLNKRDDFTPLEREYMRYVLEHRRL